MKRGLSLVLGIGLLLFGWSSFRLVHASGDRCGLVENRVKVVGRSGEGRPFVALDDLGEAPFLSPTTNETIVALRPLTSILSNATDVVWNESTRTAQFRHGDHLLSVEIGTSDETRAQLDGHPYPLRAFVCDGRLHAPLRSVTDAFGLEVRWYHSEQTAVIDPVWTTGVHTPVSQPTTAQRPSACTDQSPVGWSDLFAHPLDTWNRTVRRTACSLIL